MKSIYYISSVRYKILRKIRPKVAWNKQIKEPHPHDVDSSTKETWFMHSTIVEVVYQRQDWAMDGHTTT
jgi:predicted membrane protein